MLHRPITTFPQPEHESTALGTRVTIYTLAVTVIRYLLQVAFAFKKDGFGALSPFSIPKAACYHFDFPIINM